MAVNLKKGEKVDLAKYDSELKQILIGLRWSEKSTLSKSPVDCDAFALLLDKNKKILTGNDIVYHANLEHYSKSVIHQGDNISGTNADDDCEQIIVELSKIPEQIQTIIFAVNIYQPEIRQQDFGVIEGARIQVINNESQKILCTYNLSDSYGGMTTVIVAELSREGVRWCFNAIGQGTSDKGIGDVMRRYR